MFYNIIAYLDLPLPNTSTARRRTAPPESGAHDGANYATPLASKCISQPDLEPELRRSQSRRSMRIPGREVVTPGLSPSEGGNLISPATDCIGRARETYSSIKASIATTRPMRCELIPLLDKRHCLYISGKCVATSIARRPFFLCPIFSESTRRP